VIGPHFSHFAEAIDLVNLKGCNTINNKEELSSNLMELITNSESRIVKGKICSDFVQKNKGAVNRIMEKI
jgi:3-deoxy-D-manno-octulosonic-acid transferase